MVPQSRGLEYIKSWKECTESTYECNSRKWPFYPGSLPVIELLLTLLPWNDQIWTSQGQEKQPFLQFYESNEYLCLGFGLSHALQREWGNFPFTNWNGICWGLPFTACTIDRNKFYAPFGIFYVRTEIWKEIFPKVIYKPLMGCSLFSNFHFQMGVTVIGFAEHFGHSNFRGTANSVFIIRLCR